MSQNTVQLRIPLSPPAKDAAGELFRNNVRTANDPLNPPTLGDFEDLLPQNWGLGGLKSLPELSIFPTAKFAISIFKRETRCRALGPLS